MLNLRWAEGLTPEQIAQRLRKPTPGVLVKQASKKAEAKYLREQKKIAKRRDRSRCRVCGAGGYVEVDHVDRRSNFGSKRVVEKHHHSNLWCLCAGPRPNDVISCHKQKTGNVLKVTATTHKGTNGPVEVLKLDPKSGDYRLVTRSA